MGALRFILSISVVFSHTYGFLLVGGQIAVQLFYIISGFLISYSIANTPAYRSVAIFYINRYLRVYPAYAITAFATLVTYLVFARIYPEFSVEVGGARWNALTSFEQSSVFGKIMLIVSNAFIFFQDWTLFLETRNNDLALISTSSPVSPLWEGLLVPQAWTLGVELTFYAIAPFVVASPLSIAVCILVSILARAILVFKGLGMHLPWTYCFFPNELIFFLSGVISHRYLAAIYKARLSERSVNIISDASTVFLALFAVFYSVVPVRALIKQPLLFAVFICALPFVFEFQERRSFDRVLGALSFPIYVGHMLVIMWATFVFRGVVFSNDIVASSLLVSATIVFASLLLRFVINPFEMIRARLKGKP